MACEAQTGESRKYRRKAAACGGGCAALSALPILVFSHDHRAIGILCIAIQAVLLVLAVRFLMRAKQAPGS